MCSPSLEAWCDDVGDILIVVMILVVFIVLIVSSDNDSDDGGGDLRWLRESFAAGATRAFIAVSLFASFVSLLASTERTDIVATIQQDGQPASLH